MQFKLFIYINREKKFTLHPPFSFQNNRKGKKNPHIIDMSHVVLVTTGEQPEIIKMRSV